MGYSKLAPWPFIDPDAPLPGYLKVGESVQKFGPEVSSDIWNFYTKSGYLIINNKIPLPDRIGKIGRTAIQQYEYPIEGARWFVDTVERFFLPPDHPNAVPPDKFNVCAVVAGETLGVTRGVGFGGDNIPGYSFDNLNRIEHSTLPPDGPFCEMFLMGDPWLFEDGLFDLFKEIASRHEAGEF